MERRKKKNFAYLYKESGLEVLLKELKSRSEKNFFLKSLLKFDQKHFFAHKFLNDLVNFEKNIPKYGLKKQATKFINKLKLNTAVYSDISNKNFQNQKGLLIYGVNHNAFIEPIILFSLLNQKKVKLILFRMYYFLGKHIQKYSLPVAARNYSNKRGFGLVDKFDPSQRFRRSETLSDSQIIKNNDKSIKSAAKTLEEGGIVVIFPGGGGSELKKWGFGISRIILNIKKEKRGDVSLLPVYFSGMGYKRMLFRIIKAYKKIKQGSLRVGVYFGKEKTISVLYRLLGNRISEEAILTYLRKDAFSQYGLKEYPFKVYLYPRNYPLALARSFAFLTKIMIQILPFRDFFRG